MINYTSAEVPWTRVIEHKHFELGNQSGQTLVTHEYPDTWTPEKIPYYPVNDAQNNQLYASYQKLAELFPKVHFSGRLGAFKYLDMHQIIAAALHSCKTLSRL